MQIRTQPPAVQFVASPGSLRMSAVRGNQSLAVFSLRNAGDLLATDVSILLPAVTGLSVFAPVTGRFDSIAPGQTVQINLQYLPAVDAPISTLTGQLVVRSKESQLGVSMTLATVSQLSGTLIVYVEDGKPSERVVGRERILIAWFRFRVHFLGLRKPACCGSCCACTGWPECRAACAGIRCVRCQRPCGLGWSATRLAHLANHRGQARQLR